jgi:DNA-binding winged helix-turn-helix (wHTH) protein/TolB-like protein
MTPDEALRIGDWLIHPSLNRATRGPETVGLQPRFMDLLVYLAQRPGKVVSKEEIFDAVWAKEFVSEGTLTHAVAVIRQTLGDDVRNPHYIETIPTRGYRLIAPVGPPEAEAGSPLAPATPVVPEASPTAAIPSARRLPRASTLHLVGALLALVVIAVVGLRWWSAGHGSATAGGSTRIVVLPFESFGPAARDYLAEGITDDITTRLGAAHEVAVTSRTTAAYCAKTPKTAPQIGRELGVDYILEGAVQWEPEEAGRNEIRVNAQLIRAARDTLVWGESYRVALASVVDVGATIAARVVQELGVKVGGPEESRLAARPTTNSDAYQAFLCGMRYHDLESREQLGLAAAMFERAVSLDPSFALAYAELSLVQSRRFGLGIDSSPGQMARAEEAAARALALRPDLPEVHLALGAVDHLVKRNFESALQQYRFAAGYLPNDSEIPTLIADVQRRQGKWEEARAELEKTVAADPGNYGAFLALGDTLSPMRLYAEADGAYLHANNLSPDRNDPYVRRFWNYLVWDGKTGRAESVLNDAPLQSHPAVMFCRSYLAYVRRDIQGALAAAEGVGDELAAGPFRGIPGQLLECLYNEGVGNGAVTMAACGDARKALVARVAVSPTEPWPWLGVALADASLGHPAEAVREAARGADLCPVSLDAYNGPACLLDQAEVLARVGEAAQASAILQRLLAIPSTVSVAWLRLDPRWDRVRNAPSFKGLVESAATSPR